MEVAQLMNVTAGTTVQRIQIELPQPWTKLIEELRPTMNDPGVNPVVPTIVATYDAIMNQAFRQDHERFIRELEPVLHALYVIREEKNKTKGWDGGLGNSSSSSSSIIPK
jgi:hypothetical protein